MKEKTIFLGTLGLVLLGTAFLAGLYSGVSRNAAFKAVWSVKDSVTEVLSSDLGSAVGGRPEQFLQPAFYDGEGVTYNDSPRADDLIFITAFFPDDDLALKLIRRDGTVVRTWPARFFDIFTDTSHLEHPPLSNRHLDIHGATLNPDGSVVFNFEYFGTVKMDRCGGVLWALPERTHHSVEPSERGGYLIPGQRITRAPDLDNFPPFTHPHNPRLVVEDDTIMRVSDEGEIIEEVSIPRILLDSGLLPIMTAIGTDIRRDNSLPDQELVHVNKIAELKEADAAAFPMFEAGDLLLSLRTYNLLVVIDPDTWTVKWHQTGPWLRQHDSEFAPDGTIRAFNNNTFMIDLLSGNRRDPDIPRQSNILAMDPVTREVRVVYGDGPDEAFMTVLRGKQHIVPGGGTLITESEGGRVFEVDETGNVVWEYVNRYDDDEVLEITEARLYGPEDLDVTDWSCHAAAADLAAGPPSEN